MKREEVRTVDWLGTKVRALRQLFTEARPGSQYYACYQGDILPFVAWVAYGKTRPWYILGDLNGVFDPFQPLEAGDYLLIPPL